MCALAAVFTWSQAIVPPLIDVRVALLIMMVIHTLNVNSLTRRKLLFALAASIRRRSCYAPTR